MKNLLSILNSKVFLYVLIGIVVVVFLQSKNCDSNKNEALETYNRQLQGQLSDKEKELQETHTELGLAKSDLVTRKELAESLKKDNEEKDKNFDKFKEEHNLKIKSKDRAIASLKQKINKGTSSVVILDPQACNLDNCVISYSWEDNLGRFKLKDPNILEINNETFESNQLFKVYGEIWEQQDGSLQTRRLVLREVYKDESGKYKDIEDAKADIIDFEFQYHNPPTIETEFNWKDLFRLRGIVVAGVNAFPNSGNAKLGLGLEFFTWKGLGINSHTSFDFDDATQISQNLGLIYNPTIFNTELNLGIGVSGGTPFASFFKEFMLSIDLVFYVNN